MLDNGSRIWYIIEVMGAVASLRDESRKVQTPCDESVANLLLSSNFSILEGGWTQSHCIVWGVQTRKIVGKSYEQ